MEETTTKMQGYPIGQQDFKQLRERGLIYVDKTEFIDKIVNSGSQHFFLARPRRFGKSLFLSSLKYFFQGEKELFKGLCIYYSSWNWDQYPVLHLDLNTDRYAEKGKLEDVLDNLFKRWEAKYCVTEIASSYPQRFKNIIEAAHEKTGRKAVILVDEYDKPLVGNLNKKDNFEHYRTFLASIYSNFKSSADHIRLVFLTGVSRFSKLSVFSDLNNLDDITFENDYADICGITEKEMLTTFHEGIRKLGEVEGWTFAEARDKLKLNYDGYRFAATGSDIYNPWSLLNALKKSAIENYWNDTGMPTIVAESLKRINADLQKTFDSKCRTDELKGLDLLNPNPTALLYQTGYLTIKSYNQRLNFYRLCIPNKEVERGLFAILLPYYVQARRGTINEILLDMVDAFVCGQPEEAMLSLQAFFAGIDYKMKIENENNFHNAFYLLTHTLGLDVKTEAHTSDDSIDLIIDTDEYLYIIELKYDRSAEDALRQIEEKKYSRPWQTDSRSVFLIGVAFSSKSRCIEDWIIKISE